MSFSAGQKVSTATLDTIASVAFQSIGAASTSTNTMGASFADLTGTSLTFTTQYANTKVNILSTFDVQYSNNVDIGVGGPVFVGTVNVDGVDLFASGEAHFLGVRATAFQTWPVTLSAAGSHTIKLRGRYNGGTPTGTIQTLSTHTRWTAIVFGP